MAITKITYENKEAIQNDTSVANKSKVTDADMNEIKQVVNGNADELNTAKDDIEDLQSGQGTASADITSLKNRVSTLETDNTKNKSDINTLKSDNQTNKSNISTMQGQISEIQQEQKTQNTDIENLQINDTKQDSLISKLKNALINAETEESKSLYVTDVNKFGQLEVFGNKEQETRSGKNLFDKNNMNILQGYIDGSGSIIYNTSNKIAYIECPKNTDITVSGKYLRGIACYNQLPTYNLQTSVKNINQATYLTLNSGDNTYLAVWYYENNSGYTEQEITDTVQVEVGNVATEYEQFGASPSPEYPSPVVCLGSNKNELDIEEIETNSYASVIDNQNGILELEGINGFYSGVYIEKQLKPNTDYTICAKLTEVSDKGRGRIEVNSNSNFLEHSFANLDFNKELVKKSISFKTDATGLVYIIFYCNWTGNNEHIKYENIKLEEGTEATSYSPYGQGSTKISKINKNIFDKNNVNILQGYIDGSGNIQYNTSNKIFYIKCLKNIDVTVSGIYLRGIACYNKIPTYNLKTSVKNINQSTSLTINTDDNTYLAVWYYENTTEYTEQQILDSIQVEKGNVETNHVEHEQTDYLLYIQQEMLEGDYFIKEADGWKEVHDIGIYETDEEDDWQMNTSGLYFLYNAIKSSSTNNIALSTHFKFNSRTSGMTALVDGEFALQPQYENNPIYCKDNSSATLQDFKNRLATEKVKFYYNLATPTKLDCTEEQSAVLEELNNLDLFEGVNNIITAENIALLKLKYSLDVETYVDNKLNTINQQILEIAGGN